MSLSIGIIGLPNVGKSTLFNALTKKKAEASNYPFCTIEPNVGLVEVPDERLSLLSQASKSKQTIPAAIKFVDIAGLVKGAHKGEGLGNKFLSHIRECDAVCQVVRNFENENIVHVEGKLDPVSDKETIGIELIFADLETVRKRMEKTAKEAKSGKKEIKSKLELLDFVIKELEKGVPARKMDLTKDQKEELKDLHLLTWKPIIYVVNGDAELDRSRGWDGEVITINAKTEEEIVSLPEEEQKEYLEELGMGESGLDKLIKSSYKLLDLITFFTSGEPETRAWTLEQGGLAPQAAGVIHTDFEKGFIRAEVVDWKNFCDFKGWAGAKEKGLVRTEGKNYEVKDGDVCHFLFSS